MQVSIIIPNYNGKEFLDKCISSLINEIDTAETEIILVDNNSKDGSCEYVKLNYPFIHLIRLNDNYGFSYAVNRGIEIAKGKYVVLLNNDTVIKPNWLSSLIIEINQNEKIFSVSSKMLQMHNINYIDDAGDDFLVLGWAVKRGDGMKNDFFNKSDRVFSACAGAAIYRRELFESIGLFDENFFAYLEDVDIGFRANLLGYENRFASSAEIYHIGSATSGGANLNSFKVKLSSRNMVYLIYKNMSTFLLLCNALFLLLGWLVKWVRYRKRGFSKEFIEGTKEGIKGLSKIKRMDFRKIRFREVIKIEMMLIKASFNYVKMRYM